MSEPKYDLKCNTAVPEEVSTKHDFDRMVTTVTFSFESAERTYSKEDGQVAAVPRTFVRCHFDWSDLSQTLLYDLAADAMKIKTQVRRPIHEELANDPTAREFTFTVNDDLLTKKVTRSAKNKLATTEDVLKAVAAGKIDKQALLALLAEMQ